VWTCNFLQEKDTIEFSRQNSTRDELVDAKPQKQVIIREPKKAHQILSQRNVYSALKGNVKTFNLEIEEIRKRPVTRPSTTRNPTGGSSNQRPFCQYDTSVSNTVGFQPLTSQDKSLIKDKQAKACNPARTIWMLERHHVKEKTVKKCLAPKNVEVALVSFSNEAPSADERKQLKASKIGVAKAAERFTGRYVGSSIVVDSSGWESSDIQVAIDEAGECAKEEFHSDGRARSTVKRLSRSSQSSKREKIKPIGRTSSAAPNVVKPDPCLNACGLKPTSNRSKETSRDTRSPVDLMLNSQYEEFSAPFSLRKPLSFRTVVSMIQFFVELTKRITKLQR
jgi:hypothetical protein